MFFLQNGTFLCFQTWRSSSDLTVYVQTVLGETSELKIRLMVARARLEVKQCHERPRKNPNHSIYVHFVLPPPPLVLRDFIQWDLCEYVIVLTSVPPSPSHSVDLAGGKPKWRTAHKPNLLCWTFHSLLNNRQRRFDLCNCQFSWTKFNRQTLTDLANVAPLKKKKVGWGGGGGGGRCLTIELCSWD